MKLIGTKNKTKNKIKEKVVVNSNEEFIKSFEELALLLNTDIETLKQECILNQLQKLMSKTGNVICSLPVTEEKVKKVFFNAITSKTGEVMITPAFLDTTKKIVHKFGLEEQKVNLLIDFPFGESLFKTKLYELMVAKKYGIDSVTVVMPYKYLVDKQTKLLKKQANKIAKIFGYNTSIAIPANSLSEEDIKLCASSIKKSKISSITFIFGSISEKEFEQKMSLIKKHFIALNSVEKDTKIKSLEKQLIDNKLNKTRKGKQIRVLASIHNLEGVQALIKTGADFILTPFADEISVQLAEKFNIKGLSI